jgi:hypothetical protein
VGYFTVRFPEFAACVGVQPIGVPGQVCCVRISEQVDIASYFMAGEMMLMT